MNLAHLHLIANHVPVVASMLALLALTAALFVKKRDALILALILASFAGLSVVPAYLSGEPAEDVLQELKLPHVRMTAVHDHEDAAQIAGLLLLIAGLLAMVALAAEFKKAGSGRKISQLVCLLLLAGWLCVSYTAFLGGHISHRELGLLR